MILAGNIGATNTRLALFAAVIAQAALAEKNELCVQALNLFVSLYGAEGKSGVKDDGNGWSVHWGRDRAEDSAKVAGALPAGGLLRERSHAPFA